MRRSYHVTAACLLLAAGAHAAPLAGGAGSTLEGTVLVGGGGEIYRRGDGAWHRAGGGVAVALVAVWGDGAGNVWALGAAAPAYRHDGRAWLTVAGTRGGPATLAVPGSPRPGLTVRRLPFFAAAGRLQGLPATPRPAAALWVAGERNAAALVEGKLLRFTKGWKPIPIAGGETLIGLCGGPRGLVAFGAAGGVFLVAARGARRVALAGFAPALCGASRGRVVLAAAGGALAELDAKGALIPLPSVPLAAGDALVALLPFPAGGELAATRGGHVYVRGAAGEASFHEEPLDDAPPPTTGHPGAPPATIPAPDASR